jgi:hypothetical protein
MAGGWRRQRSISLSGESFGGFEGVAYISESEGIQSAAAA